ncbi:sigma-70 family RNA polymerase sigma factor, partial [Leclercia adecarboxylata]|uniref:sigma-70 family RNA polymerase sigma factor n=1 Tax=Leclercia adecarboxylata TaxID=83655 RepID=UPI00234D5813
MTQHDPFHQGIIECLPHLRGFAHLLARNHALAEDLVQDTVLRAISHRDQFKPGTNLRGWLVIILRNRYFNDRRRDAVRQTGAQILSAADTTRSGGQEEHLELRDFSRAFDRLPPAQREA